MDRMDCQMVMILFTYVYLTSFVLPAAGISSSNSKSVLSVKPFPLIQRPILNYLSYLPTIQKLPRIHMKMYEML